MSEQAMPVKEQIIQELDRLTEAELGELRDFLAFLQFRGRLREPTAAGDAEAGQSGYTSPQIGYEAMAADTEREQAALDRIEIASDGG